MKFLLPCLLLTLSAFAQVPIIPLPSSIREAPDAKKLVLRNSTTLALPPQLDAKLFRETLAQASGLKFETAPANQALIIFETIKAPASPRPPTHLGGRSLTSDSYSLTITAKGIRAKASTPAGHFYALQSLAQIFQASAHNTTTPATLELSALAIDDQPRFAWRGYMLDESRHFTGETGILRLLDAMAHFKLNRLHWHLTDSPAWRIEIRKYPELTRIGSRGSETDRSPDAPPAFYTQEQIRRIVTYARTRGITIVPEIDMPGHADAAVKAYPQHDGGGYLQKGSKDKWPHFTFNPAKQETLQFLDDILSEVAQLFPDAGVIHFGGDEVHFGWHQWPKLPEVQDLMKKEKLKDLAAVETWFSRRMAHQIHQLGFSVGAWDEITPRQLPQDKTLVFWWRHDKPQVLRQALNLNYPVVLCPRRPCYFDFVQHESHQVGRRWNGFNPIQDTYNFPAPLKLSPAEESKVAGIQACLWTETCLTQARRDFMTWPRLIALAESAWTPETSKDFTHFQTRLPQALRWLETRGIGYYDASKNSPEISDRGARPDYLDTPE